MLVKNVAQNVGTHSKPYGGPFGHNKIKSSQQNKKISTINVIEVLVNAMHSGRPPYCWDFDILAIFPYA